MGDRLAIYLAEKEHAARRGDPLPPKETLEIIWILRGYMAFAETANRAMNEIQDVIDGGTL